MSPVLPEILFAATVVAALASTHPRAAARRRARAERRILAGAGARQPAADVPGLRRDGRPLDAYERRILGRVEMDALIRVPEPDYTRRGAR